MGKRILAAFLWFFTGWCVGAFAAYLVGGPEVIAPVIGAAFAAIVAGDPRHIIWQPARQAEKAREIAKARLEELPAIN